MIKSEIEQMQKVVEAVRLVFAADSPTETLRAMETLGAEMETLDELTGKPRPLDS